MTQPDPGPRLHAAITALCDPTLVRVDRLAITEHDRDAVRATNTEAARNHRDQIDHYRKHLARYADRGDHAGTRRLQTLIDRREAQHKAAIERRRVAEAVVPSLLDRLQDAVQSTQGGGGASAGVHRAPIGLSAAWLLAEIAEAVQARGAPLATAIRAWAADPDRADPDIAEKWVTAAAAVLEPPRMAEIPRRCPACRTRYVWTPEGDEWIRRAALQINKTAAIATCTAKACGAIWPKERWPLLAAALDQDDDEVDDMQTR